MYISTCEEDTITIARDLAGEITGPVVICLYGTLGMGKTVFSRALIRALCADETIEVISPTFNLVQIYDGVMAPIYHFDLYRLEDAQEIFALGWEEAVYDGITIVEWPERLGAYKPNSTLDIHITTVNNNNTHRMIEIVKP